MHKRLVPKEHAFSYQFFSFYIDLDEIDALTVKNPLISHNRFNVYSLYDKDHLHTGSSSIKENVRAFLKTKGIELGQGRVMLLTNLRTLGYVFNPVSFYFCFDQNDQPLCVIPEIGNTFRELKAFFLNNDCLKSGRFEDRQDKFYYISPFCKLDDQLDFKLGIPDEQLSIFIDTSKNNQKIIITSMLGSQEALTFKNLLIMTLKFPLVTLKVIALIHWHAFLLWIKKIPFEEKTANPHLQKEVVRAWSAVKKF